MGVSGGQPRCLWNLRRVVDTHRRLSKFKVKNHLMLEQIMDPGMTGSHSTFGVLGVRVDAVQIPDVVAQMERWITERAASHFIAVSGMHGVMEAQRDPSFKDILNDADFVVADGMPLVWLGRWHGFTMRRRVYGPELMETFCCSTGPRYRHYLYGGGRGVADRLAEVLRRRYEVRTVGTYSPPFRSLTEEEKVEVNRRIQAAEPDIVWVGLSTPKQERFMFDFCKTLRVPVMLGVGAAFDFHTDRVRRAPSWMRERGLEWLFRLYQEPRRLWRRYLLFGPQFAWNVSLELLGWKKF